MKNLAKPLSLEFLLLIVLLAGCSIPKIQPFPEEKIKRSGLLSFIQDGTTSRDDVLERLGTPFAEYEGERILAYWLLVDKDGEWHVDRYFYEPDQTFYSLVLVFGPDGILEKHSLVGAK